MTIRLHDNQGRDWTVEGDWSAQVVGADFDGRGQILMWIKPDPDGYLAPAPRDLPPSPDYVEAIAAACVENNRPAHRPALPAAD